MANYSQNVSFTDYGAEQQDIERRRKMAELLSQQGMQPIEQQTAGGYVVPTSWTQGLAKALQSGLGGYQQGQLKEEAKTLAAKRNQALAAALGGMPTAQTSELPGSQADQGQFNMAPQTQTTQPTMQQNANWLGQLAQIGPDATQIGGTMLGMQQKAGEADEMRDFRKQEAALARQARIDELNTRLADARITADDRRMLQIQLADQRAELARELAEGRNQNSLALKEMGRGTNESINKI